MTKKEVKSVTKKEVKSAYAKATISMGPALDILMFGYGMDRGPALDYLASAKEQNRSKEK